MKNIKKYIGLSLLLSSAVMYGGDDDFVLLDVGDDGTISERPTDDQTGRQDNGSLNAARRSQGQQTGSDRQGNQGNGRQSTSTMPTIGRLIQRAKELVIAKQPTVTKNEPVNNPVTNQPTQPMTEDQHMEQFEALAKELDKPGTMGSLWSRFMNLFGKSNEVKTYQKFVTDDMKQQTAVITKLQEISATRFLKDDEVAQLKKSFQAIEQQKALFDRLTITASSDSASPVLRSNFDALLKGKTNVEATVSDAMALIKKYKFLTLDLNDKDIQESYTTFLSKNTLFLTDDDALSSYIDKALNGDSQFHLMLDYQFAQTLAYRQKILNDRFIQIYGEDVAGNLSLEQAGHIIHDLYTRNSDMGEKYDIAVQNGLIRDLRTYSERVEAAFEKAAFRDAMTFYKNLVQRVKANGTPLDSFVLYDVEMALKSKLRDMESELTNPTQDKDFQTTYGSYKTLINDINYLQDRRRVEDPLDRLEIVDLLNNLAKQLKANDKQSELRTNQ